MVIANCRCTEKKWQDWDLRGFFMTQFCNQEISISLTFIEEILDEKVGHEV